MSNSIQKIIGIDIGKVIIGGDTDEKGNFFGPDYLSVSAIPDSFDSIKLLIEKEGSDNIFLVSKCGLKTQTKTSLYLEHHNFFNRTQFEKKNIYFCLERFQKKAICEKLNIKIFIDDRFTVLKYIAELEDRRLFLFAPNPTELELYQNSTIQNKIVLVQNWKELIELI